MRRIFGLSSCLVGLTAGFLFFAACGQGEGGRCQIDSDCASGLTCTSGSTGNGTCGSSSTVVSNNDAAPDLSVASGSDVEPDTATMSSIDAESLDTESVDTGAID